MTNHIPVTARGLVLRLLRDTGPLPRAELARRSGLSATTMTKVVAQLIDEGCVVESASTALRVGRPATDVALVPGSYWVIGVGLGRIGLGDLLGRPHAARPLTGELPQEIGNLLTDHGVDRARVLGVGVAVPEPPGPRLAERLACSSGLAAVADHDARAMALAEARYGCRARDVLYVHVDKEVRAGAVLDGRPFGGGVIDLGHLRVAEQGPACACGGTGCLAALIGGHLPGELTGELAGHLAATLAAAVSVLGLGHIRLGGQLGEAGDVSLDRLRAALLARVAPALRAGVRVDRCGLGPEAGVLGGAALALERFFYG
ncbi:ROK family protein [Nonomuraea typhae]|uniref:ROK family protein n=1 Tax=Nonomuraea typhae TaxID=2603600 RepID=A0ABW7Z175_9ACTN